MTGSLDTSTTTARYQKWHCSLLSFGTMRCNLEVQSLCLSLLQFVSAEGPHCMRYNNNQRSEKSDWAALFLGSDSAEKLILFSTLMGKEEKILISREQLSWIMREREKNPPKLGQKVKNDKILKHCWNFGKWFLSMRSVNPNFYFIILIHVTAMLCETRS